MTAIIDGTGSIGAAITQFIIAYLSEVSIELVFGLLTLLLLTSALLISPLCIKECREMRRNVVFEEISDDNK